MALLILTTHQDKADACTTWRRCRRRDEMAAFKIIFLIITTALVFAVYIADLTYGIIDPVSSCTVVPSLSCMVVATFTTGDGTSAAIAFVTAAIIGIVVMGLIVWHRDDAI